MKLGIFDVPYSLDYERGGRTPQEIIEWGLQVVEWADQYGFTEAYFAEHYTIGREPAPAPELTIAAASQRTQHIRLGAAAHLLPYHNPISLAHRLMWLDHMTGGRYIAGVAAGAFPTDAQLFGTGDANGRMMSEALDIILAIWTREGPFRIEGEYWTVDMPGYTEQWHGPHLKPLQQPHPPIALVGAQPNSATLRRAGERGFIPISQQLSSDTLRHHWETYAAAAASVGRHADRQDWRVNRNFFVADTDEEAFEYVLNGEMGRVWGVHAIDALRQMGVAHLLAAVPENELTVEYLAEKFWLIGSPDTVTAKLKTLLEETGGFGTLLTMVYDYSGDRADAYRRSFELMATEVQPRIDAESAPLARAQR